MPQLLSASEYQARIEQLFEDTARQLRQWLPAAGIEHVGSSAIPGAPSKGDLDICVLLAPAQMDGAISLLQARGYVIKADTLRTPQLCMLVSPRSDVDVALQLVETGSPFEDFLGFRDAMRADPALAEAYAEIKRRHAHLDDESYRAAKARFIEAALGRL